MKPITLYDVADYAGVSYQTVSRVVNQANHVSAKTRQKVEAAMFELNYIPNRAAQQLAGKKRPLIGIVTANLALHAPSQIIAAIKSRAETLEASVVIAMVEGVENENNSLEACQAAIYDLLTQRVSGLIISYPLNNDDAIAISTACGDTPVLFLDVSDQLPLNSIVFSYDEGTRLAVEHLVKCGHQHVALLAGPLSSISAHLRLVGWHKHLMHYNLESAIELEGDWSAKSGYQQTMNMLKNGMVATAILVANDQMALGAMRALSEFGLRIPQDVSVIGYDDTADSAYYIPPLTTIRQNFSLLGKVSVDTLLQLSRRETTTVNLQLSVSLIERDTVYSLTTK